MTKSNSDLLAIDRHQSLSFTLRFIYSVAIPNALLWSALAVYLYRPGFWKALRDYLFYDGPAASPNPLQIVLMSGAAIFVFFLATCFLLLALVLTMLTACCPWERWYSSLVAGVISVVIAALPFGAVWMYYT